MHKLTSAFVLGYHGCDRSVAESLLSGVPFNVSENEWDWLGSGVYFWEANPKRGLEFAELLTRRRTSVPVRDPYVVGAVIDLGLCLDLTTSNGIQAVEFAHKDFLEYCARANAPIPRNEGGEDFVFRKLDCAVINHLHRVREATNLSTFDTVKGVFTEGVRLYEESGFFRKTHIQICVRNLGCIKGIFRVSDDQLA